MFQVKFADKCMEFDAPITVFDAAKAAELVSRAHVAAEVGGKTVAMTQLLDADCEVKLLTFADKAGKHVFWHSASHVLAQAVKRLYPAVNQHETPLPRSWSPKDKYHYIGLSQGNLRVHYKGIGLLAEGRKRPDCPRGSCAAQLVLHHVPSPARVLRVGP